MSATTRSLTCLLSLGLLAACESASTVAPQPDPVEQADPKTVLRLDFTSIDVIADCDGIEGDGDFRFKVATSPSWENGSTIYDRKMSLGSGKRTGALGGKEYRVDASNGLQVNVSMTSWETDKPLIGATYHDSRMNGVQRTAGHSFRDGRWTNTGARSITVGSGDCAVRLNYLATQVQ